jgi:O-antigen/teichoic acid export membrane protein
VVILSQWADTAAIGWYGAASKVIAVINTVPVILIPALFPVLAESYADSPESFKRLLSRFFELFLLLGIGLAMPLTIFSGEIVQRLFGPQFTNAAPILQILSWSCVAVLVSQVLGYGLISSGRQWLNAWICGLGLVANLTANVILIPKYHHLGLAWSTLITEVVIGLGELIAVWRLNLVKINGFFIPKIVALTLIYFGILHLQGLIAPIYLVPLVFLSYVTIMAAFGFITRNDVNSVALVLNQFWLSHKRAR